MLVLDCEPVDDAPVLDLRIRKGVRRNGVALAVATSRPSSLDPNAQAVARFAPGAGEAFCAALNAALGGSGVVEELAEAAGADAAEVRAIAALLSDAGEDVVIVYGERLTGGPRGAHAARALLNVAGRVVTAGHDGCGLLELPSGMQRPRAARGRRAAERRSRADARLLAGPRQRARSPPPPRPTSSQALYLLHVDPLRDLPNRRLWKKALARATTVVAHAAFLTEGLWEHADVVFPAESYAEKEGTITHPDGRVQRLRPAIARPDAVRGEWSVLADLCKRLDHDPGVLTGPMTSTTHVRRDPLLRWADARRDRRARGALAGPRAGRRLAGGRPRPVRPRGAAVRAGPQRRAAAGHVPLDLGGSGGRALARAEVPARAPARRAVAGRRGAPRDRPRRSRRSSPRTARGWRRSRRCGPRFPRGRSSSSRASAARTRRPSSTRASWRSCPHDPRRGHVRRAVVGADR